MENAVKHFDSLPDMILEYDYIHLDYELQQLYPQNNEVDNEERIQTYTFECKYCGKRFKRVEDCRYHTSNSYKKNCHTNVTNVIKDTFVHLNWPNI